MRLILLIVTALFFGETGSGQWTEPVLLPPPINVNPPGDYYYSTISADGQVLCLTISPSGFGDDDVWFSERIGDSAWTVPVNAGPNVNNNQRNLSPSITNDRQRLYYVSWTGSYDIFVSYRTGPDWDDWSLGIPLGQPVDRGAVFTGQISSDDSTLVFTSTTQPGPLIGEHAMYTSRLQPDNSWSEPELVGYHLNNLNGSRHPCLTDYGNTIVYGQFGGVNYDIYYAMRNDTGFGPGIRCDSTINTEYWDSSPSCPTDGSLLYFDSRRTNPEFQAARLYVAERVNATSPRRPTGYHPATIVVAPTLGTTHTAFRISLPTHFGTKSLRIYNVTGQVVFDFPVDDITKTQFIWKGVSNGAQFISAGSYFVVATGLRDQTVAKVVVLP